MKHPPRISATKYKIYLTSSRLIFFNRSQSFSTSFLYKYINFSILFIIQNLSEKLYMQNSQEIHGVPIELSKIGLAAKKFPIRIEGHRGAGHLEPENSLKAFKRAIELGIDGVEFDVGF